MLKCSARPDDRVPGRCASPSSSNAAWPTHGRTPSSAGWLTPRSGSSSCAPAWSDIRPEMEQGCSEMRRPHSGVERPPLTRAGSSVALDRDASGRPAVGETRAGIAPTGGRSDWLEAIQLSAQAISDLTAISAASNAPTLPEIRSAALAAWEARHRDRIGRWARRALADSRAALHGDVDGGGAETATGLDRSDGGEHRSPASCCPVHDASTPGHIAGDGTPRPSRKFPR